MTVVQVTDRRLLEAFLRVPWRVYRGDGDWVPPLLSAERKTLDPARNPFWNRAEAAHFLAQDDDGLPAARISAIANRGHNEFHQDKVGFWGYFECPNDAGMARALFDRAARWLKDRGMDRMRGPVNPSMNDPCGLLVDGFGFPPFVLMPYNRPYYPTLVEGAGFTKAMDLLAYVLFRHDLDRLKVDRVARLVRERSGATLRPVDLGHFRQELEIVKEVYNDGWERHWGFVPMTGEEIEFAAADLKAILLPGLAWIAEVKGRPVGFGFALPNINLALKECDGRLFPFGWWRLLRFNLAKIPTFRVVAMGVRRDFQHLGLGTLFYQKFMDVGIEKGYQAAEISWILETNALMIRGAKLTGAKHYKTYRIYEGSI